jgi:predicted HTH domain antitoxin
MAISINIPKDQEQTLRNAWGSGLDRAAFEGLVVESYRVGRMSAGEVAELLGFGSSLEAVSWLGEKGVYLNYSLADLEADRRVLEQDFPELRR